jgi:hypothetical protein
MSQAGNHLKAMMHLRHSTGAGARLPLDDISLISGLPRVSVGWRGSRESLRETYMALCRTKLRRPTWSRLGAERTRRLL